MKHSLLVISIFIISCCSCNMDKQDKKSAKVEFDNGTAKINLAADISIVIPGIAGKFEACKPYSHFEIWKNGKRLYKDSSSSEFRFECDSSLTRVRELSNNRYEILIEKFDAPDSDKIMAFYLKGDEYESQRELPFFKNKPQDIDNDGKDEVYGILSVMEGYTADSCYYNPTLYYEITNTGIMLDSVLTIKMNSEIWGGFHGYISSADIKLPCPRQAKQ